MVLSEEILKTKYRKVPFKVFEIEKGTLLTPSAKQFIVDKGIELLEKDNLSLDKKNKDIEKDNSLWKNEKSSFQYVGLKGEVYQKKTDYLTQIEGNILVLKKSKRILFRGKIETFLAELLLLAKELEINFQNDKLNSDIESLVRLLNNILVSENLNKILENQLLLDNKTFESIRLILQEPKKYLNRGHLVEVSLKNDILVHKLNKLRALARELEVQAVDFFVSEDRIERKDLLEAFNILSSAIYLMMLKADNNEYKKK